VNTSHRKRNENVRLEAIDPQSDEGQADLLAFFRRLRALPAYWEFVLPSAKQGNSLALAAVLDRPWPPWGIGALTIQGLIYLYPLEEGRAGMGGLFVRLEQTGNLGMLAALYKEALEEAVRQGHGEVGYLVRDDSFLVDRVLRTAGFERGEEVFLTDSARYGLYTADAEEVLRSLDLAGRPEQGLLAFELDDPTADRLVLFFSALQVSLQPWIHDPELPSELRPVFSGLRAGYEPGTPP
jgi:hypothetical protein